jgi:hypothetical protein
MMKDPQVYYLRSAECDHLHEIRIKNYVTQELREKIANQEKLEAPATPEYEATLILKCKNNMVQSLVGINKQELINRLSNSNESLSPNIVFNSSDHSISNYIYIQIRGVDNKKQSKIIFTCYIDYLRTKYISYNIQAGDDLDQLFIELIKTLILKEYSEEEHEITIKFFSNNSSQKTDFTQLITFENTCYGFSIKSKENLWNPIKLIAKVGCRNEYVSIVSTLYPKNIQVTTNKSLAFKMEVFNTESVCKLINKKEFFKSNIKPEYLDDSNCPDE